MARLLARSAVIAARSAATRSAPRSAAALLAANRTPQFALLASSASRTLSTTPARRAEGEGDAEDKKKALKTYDQVKSKVEKVCKEFEKINQEKFSLNVRLYASTHQLSTCCYVYAQSIALVQSSDVTIGNSI